MAVGNQGTVSGINSQVSVLAVQLRNMCQQIENFEEYIATLGVTGLEALGFSATDAASVVTMSGYMNTVAQIYEGTVQQGGSGGTGASLFNFGNALSGLWAGQP